MKFILLPLVFLLAATVTAFAKEKVDPYRTFTDDQGRTVRAALIRAAADDVWIRRDDGRIFRLPIATFISADQNFIARWRILEALKAPQAFEFSARRYSDGREVITTRTQRTTTKNYGYIVTLTNRTPFDLENLEIEYRYYALRGSTSASGQNRPRDRFSGWTQIPRLPSRGAEEFQTPAIPIRSSVLRGDRVSSNRRPSSDDDLGGIWVRITYEGELVGEFSSPVRLMDNEIW